MQSTLSKEKISRTYRHYSVPPTVSVIDNRKMEFFYVGKRAGVIDSLIKTFDSGYAAESPEQAKSMLKKLTAHDPDNTPDLILIEGSLGYTAIAAFYTYLSSQKQLKAIPLLVEGTALLAADLEKFKAAPAADDVITLGSLSPDQLMGKIKFWTRVRDRISKAEEPVEQDLVKMNDPVQNLPKRIFDVAIACLLLVLLLPVFLLIMLVLRIESKGPVFYISKRAGRGYNIFNFYKFRTMRPKANDSLAEFAHRNLYNPLSPNGPVFVKIDNDPRITRIGAFLRKCSLDELPQLINVLKGDMSLVGNRPLPLYEAATLTTDQWAKRFMAPAGMTGLWQIRRKDRYKMSAEERVTLDINYADKSNFLFDLWIMANTPSAVIQRNNA